MKKYIDKLKELKSNNKKLFVGVVSLLLLVGVTFAFVAAQISGGALKLLNLGAQATDQLEFVVDKELSIRATQENFTAGGNNLSDTAVATAKLKANNTNNTANYTYNVYLMIDQNEFKYTTTDKKTEVLLQVTDPNNNSVTSIEGLTYDNTLQGFDITEATELVTIASNYAITSSSSSNYTTQNWTFTITFINLDTNQKENAGKELTGQIIIQRNKYVLSDITIAISNFENKYGASTANLECDKDGVSYDLKYKSYRVSSLNGRTKCNVNYETPSTKSYLNQYIIDLLKTKPYQGDGNIVHETFTNDSGNTVDAGYRYEGKNPNNFVWFNNELWRIIGVFDENTHGQTDDTTTETKENQLVKLVRANSIGGLARDLENKEIWDDSNLKQLLNGAYYNKENGNDSGYCYSFSRSTLVNGNCDYSKNGIDENYRNMIKNVIWKLGIYSGSSGSATANKYYMAERGDSTQSSSMEEVNAYIGLIYASDYGYSVLSSSCVRTTILSGYGKSACAGQSWLGNQGQEWLLNPLEGGYSLFISENYSISNTSVALGFNVTPSLYLDASVYVISGKGTEVNPYIIGI